MKDVFGNYVIQKCIEFGPQEHVLQLLSQINGSVLSLTKHIYACRVVQKFIEVLDLDKQMEIIDELKDHIYDWIFDLYGNHVIQKIIEKVPPEETLLIQSWALENCRELCLHTYGCRIIQRIIEYCPDSCTSALYDEIINNQILDLWKDQFGNYVIQLILEKGTDLSIKSKISESLLGQIRQLSIHKFASNVVEKCIEHCQVQDKVLIIDELIGIKEKSDSPTSDTELYKIMDNKYGNYVIQKAIEKSSIEEIDLFSLKVKSLESKNKQFQDQASHYVKHVVKCLENFSNSKHSQLDAKKLVDSENSPKSSE